MIMPMSSKTFQTPSLSVEQSLFDSGALFVIGIDEVGRGSIAGPVAVGVALIDSKNLKDAGVWPAGLRDSKLLSEKIAEYIYPFQNILDLGCGNGLFANYLSVTKHPLYLTGIDLSKSSIDAPHRPVVTIKFHIDLITVQIHGLLDIFCPTQTIANFSSA